jgi:hypothetical protein
MRARRGWNGLGICVATAVFSAAAVARPGGQGGPDIPGPSAAIVGPQACRSCHARAVAAWERSPHFSTRDALATADARRIREALGATSAPEAAERCLSCHATVRVEDGRPRPVAGVSCESCHGPAASWVSIHGDYGSGRSRATEPPDHRDERLGRSMAAGMLRPENIYRVARNCFQCHLVLDPGLVDQGGHRPGRPFELVAWSQGAVRHNFADDGRNVEAPVERRRQYFVVGRMLELETSLRGLALGGGDGPYRQTLVARGREALAALQEIVRLAPIPEVKRAIEAVSRLRWETADRAALDGAAEEVSVAAQDLGDAGHRPELAGIDPLLPAPDAYRGVPGER